MECLRIIYNTVYACIYPHVSWDVEKKKYLKTLLLFDSNSEYYQATLRRAKKCMQQIVERLYFEGYWRKLGDRRVQELYAKIHHANMLIQFYKELTNVDYSEQINALYNLIAEYEKCIYNFDMV